MSEQKQLKAQVERLKDHIAELHDKHRRLLALCLRHIKPQQVSGPREYKALVMERKNLIEALEMYLNLYNLTNGQEVQNGERK